MEDGSYKGYKTKIHCPDCATGTLRVLSSDELLEMFQTSRAVECVKHPEMLHTQYYIHPRTFEMHERWGKPKRVGVYCDKCQHFHDVDERSVKDASNIKSKNKNKPKAVKIKGYGTYYH